MSTIFISIFRFFKSNRLAYYGFLAILLTSIALGLSQVSLDDDIKKVLPHDASIEEPQKLLNNLKILDKLVIVLSASDSLSADSLIHYADGLVTQIDSAHIPNIVSVRYRIDEQATGDMHSFFYQHLPFFLTESDYQNIENKLSSDSVKATMASNYRNLLSPAGIGIKRFILKDPMSWTPLALKHLQEFNLGGKMMVQSERLFSNDLKNIFILVQTNAKDQKSNEKIVNLLDRYKAQLDYANTNLSMHYIGASAVAFANQRQIKRDIALTVGLAFTLIIIIISMFFGSWKVFPSMFVAAATGSGLSMAVYSFFNGPISALAVGVGSVLLGIAIDYAIQIYAHAQYERNMKSVLRAVTHTILLSSLTNAASFFLLIRIDADAFTDLAWLAGMSVIFVGIFALIFIPQQIKTHRDPRFLPYIDRMFKAMTFSRKTILIGVISFSAVLYFGIDKVRFEADLLKLNYMSESLSADEQYISQLTTVAGKEVYLSAKGENLEDALQANEHALVKLDSLQKKSKIASFSSVSNIYISQAEQQKKIDRWNDFWKQHSKDSLNQHIQKASAELGFKPQAFNAFETWFQTDFKPITHPEWNNIRTLMFDDFISEKDQVYILNIVKMPVSNTSNTHPFYDTFDHQAQWIPFDKQHFSELLLDVLKRNFSTLVTWSSIAVFLLLWFYYGRIELTLISMVPILLSWYWTLGMAGWLGISFNIFNVIISSLIFGLGVDYSIAVTQGLIQEHSTGHQALRSYKLSVLLSALTNIAGVGVMVFAKHPALKSMAAITVIGLTGVMILSFLLLPLMFKFLIQTTKRPRLQWVTMLSFMTSNVSMLFVLLAIPTSLSLVFVLKFVPISLSRKKLIYHHFIQKASKFIVYLNIQTKKTLLGFDKKIFETPKLLISNHQSQLDLVYLLMLHPKIIVFTNQWVWNHGVLKYFVRYADYYPLLDGIDEAVGTLKDKVAQGYSLLIFPEGTRTDNGQIKRFHKGAFKLAENLNLKIQPILLLGLFEALNKHEFFMHKSLTWIKFLPLIDWREPQWGNSLSERTKNIQNLMRDEYAILRQTQIEKGFYRSVVLNRYLYKGPVLEWYAKIKTRLEQNYKFFETQIPKQAKVVDVGCGYGFLLHYLALSSVQRECFGVDYDNDKIEVAQQAAQTVPNLNFATLDVDTDLLPVADVFIVADVLHYLPVESQKKVVQMCYKQLKDGGKLIIRDANADMAVKHQRTQWTEFLSTKVFKFNKTQTDNKELFFINQTTLLEFLTGENAQVEIVDQTKVLSNVTYVIRKNSV